MILIAASAFIVLLAAGYTAYWISSPPPPDFDAINAAEIRESMVLLLAQPSFSGDELANKSSVREDRQVCVAREAGLLHVSRN
jgi:hypothetical protein